MSQVEREPSIVSRDPIQFVWALEDLRTIDGTLLPGEAQGLGAEISDQLHRATKIVLDAFDAGEVTVKGDEVVAAEQDNEGYLARIASLSKQIKDQRSAHREETNGLRLELAARTEEVKELKAVIAGGDQTETVKHLEEQVSTLTGTLSSVHDLLGLAIDDLEAFPFIGATNPLESAQDALKQAYNMTE